MVPQSEKLCFACITWRVLPFWGVWKLDAGPKTWQCESAAPGGNLDVGLLEFSVQSSKSDGFLKATCCGLTHASTIGANVQYIEKRSRASRVRA